MAKTTFQKNLDAAKARHEEMKAENDQENLELVLPIVNAIVAKASEAFEDAKLAIAELGLDLPIMPQLNSAMNVFEQGVGVEIKKNSERLAELQASSSDNVEEE